MPFAITSSSQCLVVVVWYNVRVFGVDSSIGLTSQQHIVREQNRAVYINYQALCSCNACIALTVSNKKDGNNLSTSGRQNQVQVAAGGSYY